MSYHQLEKVKVTHTLTKQTHEAVRLLVASGEAKDVSSFIEESLQRALREREQLHLKLELEAFEDPAYTAQIAQLGDLGLEDLQAFLGEAQ